MKPFLPGHLLAKAIACWLLAAAALLLPCQGLHAMQFANGPLDPFAPEAQDPHANIEDSGNLAQLYTDSNVERLFRRADRYVQEGRYDLATVMWQAAMDSSTGMMISRDGRVYRNVISEIERAILSLPPEALAAYRLAADGAARAALNEKGPKNEADALAEVVRRYFLSSYGDVAAFRLGCLALDRYDFVEANRIFLRLLEEYPDSDIPRSEIVLRLAIINGRLGDLASAEKYFTELEKEKQAEGGPFPPQVLDLVKEDLAQATSGGLVRQISNDWLMDLGSGSRTGRMQSIAAIHDFNALDITWENNFSAILYPDLQTQAEGFIQQYGFRGADVTRFVPADSKDVQRRWAREGGAPPSQALLSGNIAFYKTPSRIMAVDVETGDIEWEGRENRFSLDQYATGCFMMGISGNFQMQTEISDLVYWGDRINEGMAISGDMIFNLEGKLRSDSTEEEADLELRRFGVPSFTRKRENWISAYTKWNGHFAWRYPSDSTAEEWKTCSILGAPTPYGKMLLFPVSENESLWLYAIDQKEGSLVWRAYLCDEPSGGCSPWASIGVAVDGGEAYVATGAGIVFALDARSGMVRWAVRYPRASSMERVSINPRRGGFRAPAIITSIWRDDTLIPVGRSLIIMASDSDDIIAIDRRTCELLWRTPLIPGSATEPVTYCLGVSGRSLFVAGPRVVRQYYITSSAGMPNGRFVKDWEFDERDTSFGRGVLTDDAIYLPVKDSVVHIDLESNEIVGRLGINRPADSEHDPDLYLPLGNLYSDGERIFAASPGCFAALTLPDEEEAFQEEAESEEEASLEGE